MAVARGFGINGKSLYSNICKPCEINLNFIVDSANGNGLGIRSLKSNGYVENIFMHTSATPGTNNGHLNPNPLVGYALIQLKNNFNVYIGGFSGVIAPLTGSNLTATVNHTPHVITALGTATLAQWQAVGVPLGLVPAVGMSFIATATATIGGSATVKDVAASNIDHIEVIGNPNASINNSNIAKNGGAYLIVQFIGSGALVTPPDGQVIGMQIIMDGSSVTVDGL